MSASESSSTPSLEERISRLEDLEAIKKMKARYAGYCDNGYQAEGMVTLFTDDAVWESNAFGTYHGKQAIYNFIDEIGKEIVWALHFMILPNIDIAPDLQHATASWYLIEFATMTRPDSDERDAVVMTAVYNDTLVKIDGEWKFSYMKVHFHQVSDLDKGWVTQQFRGK